MTKTLEEIEADEEATKAELAKHEEEDRRAPKPSMGRIVLYRDGSGNVAPAIITRVYDDGSLALHAFRDDAAGGPTFDTHGETKPDATEAGWYWPPRT